MSEEQEKPGEPAPFPPRHFEGLEEELFRLVRRCLPRLDAALWGPGQYPRAAIRLRVRCGPSTADLNLLKDIPDLGERFAAASEVAVILAREGDTGAARTAFDRAEALVAKAARTQWQMNADARSAFAAACRAPGSSPMTATSTTARWWPFDALWIALTGLREPVRLLC